MLKDSVRHFRTLAEQRLNHLQTLVGRAPSPAAEEVFERMYADTCLMMTLNEQLIEAGFDPPGLEDHVWEDLARKMGLPWRTVDKESVVRAMLSPRPRIDPPASVQREADELLDAADAKLPAKKRETKGKMIEAKMLKVLSENYEARAWTAMRWAAELGCSDGTIKGTKVWNGPLKADRAMAKAAKAKNAQMSGKRRGRRGAAIA